MSSDAENPIQCEKCQKYLIALRYKEMSLCGPCYMKVFTAELAAQAAEKSKANRPNPGRK